MTTVARIDYFVADRQTLKTNLTLAVYTYHNWVEQCDLAHGTFK